MNSFRTFFFFFLLMALADSQVRHYKKSHGSCIQCVAGNFLNLKWLMDDPWNDRRVWWKSEWADTNCLEGLVNRPFQCQGACVTIEIMKPTYSSYLFDAVLKDCSDKLFAGNNDIPQHVKENYPDVTYTANYKDYQIKYIFYRPSNDLNNQEIFKKNLTESLSHHKKIPMSLPTKVILILLAVLFGLGVLCSCYSFLKCWFKIPKCKCASRVKQNNGGDIELEAMAPSSNTNQVAQNGRVPDEDVMDDPLALDGSFPFNFYQRTARPPSAFSDLRRGLLRSPPFASDDSIASSARYFEDNFD
ncbi:hypothetical protein CAEBREN_02779 [Caenorhabditis brenneri]|uniref:Uncharacterized protein n=1 Tax=Caenorhabditis brenneri TaxID=135651 RepID=G0MHY9_CAEBE|nr:hypothetical protein CAEBREN_02779 [Caenorhabditis brenneri]